MLEKVRSTSRPGTSKHNAITVDVTPCKAFVFRSINFLMFYHLTLSVSGGAAMCKQDFNMRADHSHPKRLTYVQKITLASMNTGYKLLAFML